MSEINKNLLFTNTHFNLLLKLYKTPIEEFDSLQQIFQLFTVIASEGLKVDRASYWQIEKEELVCIDLYDKLNNEHYNNERLSSSNLPVYFDALKEGIAIVADNVLTNKYTQELIKNYLIPLGITDMLDIPILDNGKLVGVFCCEHRDDPRTWSEVDLAFARAICDLLIIKKVDFNKRKLELELHEKERKLSLITENSNDGFVVFENRKVSYMSPSYSMYLGYKVEEVIGKDKDFIFDKIHPEEKEKVIETVYKNLKSRKKNFVYQFRIKDKKGRYHWREDSASVVYNDDENSLYESYIIVSRDISLLKNSEEKVKRLYSLSKNLNEKLLDFTHIISHNIRSNTSNISMIIDLIDDTDNDDEKETYFQLLKQSNNKLSDTIYYLNETIKIRFNTTSDKIKVNLSEIIENTLLGVNGIIISEKVDLKVDIPKNIELKTIPSYFESIILNLITNAIKYKSPNRKPIIHIKAVKVNSKVEITVEDNGIGIDLKRHKDKIFGMYKTFHNNPDAIGLGLFMTKNHIDVLGGIINVESQVDKGTTFKVLL